MTSKELIVGLSISDKGVQAVEIERNGTSINLLAIDEWENTFPAMGTVRGGGGIEQFRDYLKAFLRVNHVKARRASVAFDTAMLFIHSLPVEDKASRQDILNQVRWEIGQYHPDFQAEEFITDYHIMSQNKAEGWSKILSVSVKRQDALAVERVLAQVGLELDILDVDHFSADTALRINYPDTYKRYLALVGVKENRLDISLMKNGSLESYSYAAVASNQEIVEQIGRLSRETKGIFSLTAYGPYLDRDLLVQIRKQSALLVEALNPLRHINVSDSLLLADHLSVPSYRFASAVGVALRRE